MFIYNISCVITDQLDVFTCFKSEVMTFVFIELFFTCGIALHKILQYCIA